MARSKTLLDTLWAICTLNLGTKGISIIIAVILWGVVLGSRNVEVTLEIPLQVMTSPDVVPAHEVPDKVTFRLSGPKAFLRGILDRGEEPIRVNLMGTKPALVTYRFFSDNIQVPIGVKVLSIQPPSISIKLENLKKKEIGVRLQLQGTPPEGYRMVKAEVKPSFIHVTGPESVINGITEAVSKPIDLSFLRENLNQPLDLDLPFHLVKMQGVAPRVVIEVERASANYRIKNVDIRVISSYKSKIEEKTVTALVRANSKELLAIDKNLVFGVVDLSGKPPGTYKVSVQMNLPQGIQLIKVVPEQVHVSLY